MMLPIRNRILTAHMVAVDNRAVHPFLGLLRILHPIHVDEREASGAARPGIGHQLDLVLIYISINIQLTNPNSLNTQSTPMISIPNNNNILSPITT